MALTSFTAICQLRPEVPAGDARALIAELPVGTHSPFHAGHRTHFGRIQVLDELATDQRRPLARPVLVVSCDIDGDAPSYLREIVAAAPDAFATILGCCAGGPSDAASPGFAADAVAFLTGHAIPIGLQFATSPDRTVQEVRRAVDLHLRLAMFALDHQDSPPAALRAAFMAAFPPSAAHAPGSAL